MGSIVCATRGGEGSRAAQMAAIKRAKNTGKQLVFLYVTDAGSLEGVDETLTSAVHEELTWMGKTLLHIAQRRANVASLKTDVAIREGNVQEEICRFIEEVEASLLVLGAPRGTSANVFGDDAIEQFALTVQETTGIEVEVIRPEDELVNDD